MRQLTYGDFDVNAADYDSRTAIHVAASKGSYDSIVFLIDKGADVNCVDVFGATPLFEAVRNGHDKCAELLYKHGAKLGLSRDKRFVAGWSPEKDAGSLLCLVCANKDVFYLGRLLKYGLPSDSVDYDGRSGLHIAAAMGNYGVLEVLLNHGANANVIDSFGRTPLLEAVRAQQEPCARLLHARGGTFQFLNVLFNYSSPTSDSATATSSSGSASGEKDTVVKSGTKSIEIDNSGKDTGIAKLRSRISSGVELCMAAYDKDIAYLRLLLKFGCDVNSVDYDGRTAAHICCAENLLTAILVLHEYQADFVSVSVRDRWGQTPLDEAESRGHKELAQIIRSLVQSSS